MSFCMSELYDINDVGNQQLAPTGPTNAGLSCASQSMQAFESFVSPCSSDRKFSYPSSQDYHLEQDQSYSAGHLPFLDEEFASVPATSIEPFHLRHAQQDSLRPAFGDSSRIYQLLNARHNYRDNDTTSTAYYLEEGYAALGQPRYSASLSFATAQHGFYQTPYTSSVSPTSGSPSPITAWAMTQADIKDVSSLDGDTKLRKEDAEEDSCTDKPYARLIWEALMEAPGHRMMLREIYTWFQLHTNKARESGTNGWQNSIRHNLSMNQAFENDKSDPSISRGHPKKANSVWVLTESAIKNGVQSTTRYRKTGAGKKTPASKAPAIQRQRSGARGGRAARRAAKLRRNEQDNFPDRLTFPEVATPPDSYSVVEFNGIKHDSDYLSIHTPTTPNNDLSYSFSSAFGMPTYHTDVPLFYNSDEEYAAASTAAQHGLVMQPQKDPCMDAMEHCNYGSSLHDMAL